MAFIVQVITGCGGGGGETTGTPSSTKTATLKFSSQSTNSGDQIGGFDLNVTLPAGATISTDAAGIPLSSSVYLSGQFAGATTLSPIMSYDNALRKLSIHFASASSFQLGEIITIMVSVPTSYAPSTGDITYLFNAFAPVTGNPMTAVTATAAFF